MAARFTAATINATLRAAGETFAVRQGRGYVWVIPANGSDEVHGWFSSSIPVCYVRDLGDTLAEAVATVRDFATDQRTR